MSAKPDMKPWGKTANNKIKSSVGAARIAQVSEFIRSGVPPLKGLNKCIDYCYPGLAPWAMQEYRPKGLFFVLSKLLSFIFLRRLLSLGCAIYSHLRYVKYLGRRQEKDS